MHAHSPCCTRCARCFCCCGLLQRLLLCSRTCHTYRLAKSLEHAALIGKMQGALLSTQGALAKAQQDLQTSEAERKADAIGFTAAIVSLRATKASSISRFGDGGASGDSSGEDDDAAPKKLFCDAAAGVGVPQIEANGNDAFMTACAGTFVVRTKTCTVDPCESQREIERIKRHVGLQP